GALAAQTHKVSSLEEIVVSDVFLTTDQGRITIYDLADRPGNCSSVFQAVAAGGIVVDMIVHNLTSAGRAELSFSAPRHDLDGALSLTQSAVHALDASARVAADANIARLFVLGVGM